MGFASKEDHWDKADFIGCTNCIYDSSFRDKDEVVIARQFPGKDSIQHDMGIAYERLNVGEIEGEEPSRNRSLVCADQSTDGREVML